MTTSHRRVSGLRILRSLGFLLALLSCAACDAGSPSVMGYAAASAPTVSGQREESRMWITVGEQRFAITLADNAAARAFTTLLPLTLDMRELNGNEKYADLPKALLTDADQPGTIRSGDLMLYGSRTLVVFYLTFDSSYAYTRLGKVDNPRGLAKALGRQSVRIHFSRD